jgi:hypothetical protein
MALEAAFDDLALRMRAALEALLELRVTVVEDKPLRGEAALIPTSTTYSDTSSTR